MGHIFLIIRSQEHNDQIFYLIMLHKNFAFPAFFYEVYWNIKPLFRI